MVDVTRPKKTTGTDGDAGQLVIQSRPIIGHATTIGSPVDDEQSQGSVPAPLEPSTAPTLASQSKRTVIVPISGNKEEGLPKDSAGSETTEVSKLKPTNDGTKSDGDVATGVAMASKPAEGEKVTEDAKEETAEDEGVLEEGQPDKVNAKPSAETQKALEAAAAATKREKELETLIDSRQFYVPINAVAQKRSIKHSVMMTVIVFLLAIVLIDLMLDTGVIFLAEKIPHTHFFTTSSIEQQ